MVERVENPTIEQLFCDCCGEPRREWMRATSEGQRLELSRYCARHERPLQGFAPILARLVEAATAKPAVEELPLSAEMLKALRTLACEFCGGGTVARQISLNQQRAWVLALTSIPSSDVAKAIDRTERSLSSAAQRVSEALQVAASSSGVLEAKLLNTLIRAITKPSDRVGLVGAVSEDDRRHLAECLVSARKPQMEFRPAEVLQALIPPLKRVAPQLLDVPPLVWRYPKLPLAAFAIKASLGRFQPFSAACEWVRTSSEPPQVLEAWLDSAMDQSRRLPSEHPDRELLHDLGLALVMVLTAVWRISKPAVTASEVFPRRCRFCGQKTVDVFHDRCRDHAPNGPLSGSKIDVGSDLAAFSGTVRLVERRLLEVENQSRPASSGSWQDYREKLVLDWQQAEEAANDPQRSFADQKAAVERLNKLTEEAAQAQVDIPGGRIKQVIYELRRRHVEGRSLLLGLYAVDRICCRQQRPTLKDLARRFGVTPQAISKQIETAERNIRAVHEIVWAPWEMAAPQLFDLEREALQCRALFVAVVRWLCPADAVALINDDEIISAVEKLRVSVR